MLSKLRGVVVPVRRLVDASGTLPRSAPRRPVGPAQGLQHGEHLQTAEERDLGGGGDGAGTAERRRADAATEVHISGVWAQGADELSSQEEAPHVPGTRCSSQCRQVGPTATAPSVVLVPNIWLLRIFYNRLLERSS